MGVGVDETLRVTIMVVSPVRYYCGGGRSSSVSLDGGLVSTRRCRKCGRGIVLVSKSKKIK